MRIFRNIVAALSVIVGMFFLFVGGTDIQLGFGLVLITNGLLHIQ